MMRVERSHFHTFTAFDFLVPYLSFSSVLGKMGPRSQNVESYRARQDQATPASIIAWLKAGNRRFVAGKSEHGGYGIDARERIKQAAQGQKPLAVVLSCIDSRTTPELVFDVSVGDLFTSRVGANVVNDDVLGSLEIAAASGAKVIVVLGHSDCGGVKGACNGFELGHATQMLRKVRPAIIGTDARLDIDFELSQAIGSRTASNPKYVAEVARANSRQSVSQILEQSPFLSDLLNRGEIALVSALYHVDTGEVSFDLPG